MDDVRDLYNEISELPIPKGVMYVSDDLDIDLFEYDSYIMGLASSYLAGAVKGPQDIHQDNLLSQRLDKAIEILQEMRVYKRKLDELAQAIQESQV